MALEKIEEEIPDFMITDIMMPRMDGIELIRHIKENVNTCDIPLIILSAKSSVEDRIQGLQLGIDDYIPKPFSSDYLKSRIENLIRQRKVLQSVLLSKYGAQPKKEPLEAIAYPVSQIVPFRPYGHKLSRDRCISTSQIYSLGPTAKVLTVKSAN